MARRKKVAENNPNLKKYIRYVLYMVLGMLLYQAIESGHTSFTREELRNGLAIAILVIFALLLIIRVIKQRHNKEND